MSFFKNISSSISSNSRDSLIKKALLNNLSDCVKDIQYNQYEDTFQTLLGVNESTTALCSSFEAIFLHGLKDKIIRKAKHVISGDEENNYHANFWPLVLVLSHRQNIDEMSSLININTEIGQCRAWLRIALNEGLLSSYISTLCKNISAVRPFYNKSAFVCDSEILEVANKLLDGLESCVQFKLPTNSSLLNTWPEQVLILAGMCTTSARFAPVYAGVDVANMLPTEQRNIAPNLIQSPIQINPFTINEDQALKFILDEYPTAGSSSSKEITERIYKREQENNGTITESSNTNEGETSNVKDIIETRVEEIEGSNVGNNLLGKSCWSSDDQQNFDLVDKIMVSSITSDSSHDSLVITPETTSPASLIDNTNKDSIVEPSSNLRDNIKKIYEDLKPSVETQEIIEQLISGPNTPENQVFSGLGYEIIPTGNKSFTLGEIQKLYMHLCSLSKEKGLSYQNYQCRSCQNLLGSSISKAKVCAFTGEYYCSKCMDANIFMIPSRVIHNFDFQRYPVSKRAALFLLEFQDNPWIDFKKTNANIYQNVSEMSQLHELRIQLNLLRAYIFTCRDPIIEELKKRVWPREYLYDQIHVYTIADLAHIPTGSLALQLEKVVSFARSHVLECWLCSQKGFICEVCRDKNILYPFDTMSTYRCEGCCSVFHSKCLDAMKPCPKCKRKQRRENVTLLDAVHSQFRLYT